MNTLNLKSITKRFAILSAAIAMSAVMVLPKIASADSPSFFVDSNTMTAGDRTNPTVDWANPINGVAPGDVVEFRVVALNQTSGTVAHDVTVKGILPGTTQASPLTASAVISAANAPSANVSVKVNFTGSVNQAFAYLPGHVRVFSPGCPSGCSLGADGDNSILTTGVNIGDLAFNESAQVLWKANVTNIGPSPSTSPSSSPSPSPSVSPSPVASTTTQNCTATSGSISNSGSGNNINNTTNCTNNIGGSTNTNINNTQTINNSAAPAAAAAAPAPQVVASAPSPVKELPKTGLPLAGLALSGLAPIGWGLRKFGQGTDKVSETLPYLIGKARETKKYFS